MSTYCDQACFFGFLFLQAYKFLAFCCFQAPGASEASIRNLPPSAIGDSSNFDAMGLLERSKGKLIEAFVEQVRDGSTLRVYLLPDFQFIQVFVAGIQVNAIQVKFSL